MRARQKFRRKFLTRSADHSRPRLRGAAAPSLQPLALLCRCAPLLQMPLSSLRSSALCCADLVER